MTTYPAGFVLFCSAPYDELSLSDARDYAASYGFTHVDVKIVKGEEKYVSVVAKRDITFDGEVPVLRDANSA